MSTTFSLAPPENAVVVHGITCPYDNTKYTSRRDALSAAEAHGSGPCAPAKAFIERVWAEGKYDAEFYNSEKNRLGAFPDFCEHEMVWISDLMCLESDRDDLEHPHSNNVDTSFVVSNSDSERALRALKLYDSFDDLAGSIDPDQLIEAVSNVDRESVAFETLATLSQLNTLARQAAATGVNVEWS